GEGGGSRPPPSHGLTLRLRGSPGLAARSAVVRGSGAAVREGRVLAIRAGRRPVVLDGAGDRDLVRGRVSADGPVDGPADREGPVSADGLRPRIGEVATGERDVRRIARLVDLPRLEVRQFHTVGRV